MCAIFFEIFPFSPKKQNQSTSRWPMAFPPSCVFCWIFFFFALRPVGDKSHSTFGKPKGSYCDLDPTWGVGFPWWMDDGWLEDCWLMMTRWWQLKDFLFETPNVWGNDPIWRAYVSNGLHTTKQFFNWAMKQGPLVVSGMYGIIVIILPSYVGILKIW